MAIFKLGAIVTGIVGSIGGTTFKRSAGNLVMSKKSFGGSKTKLLQNKQLNSIGQIFKKWSLLTSGLRADWEAKALLFTFPDKFGILKYLTGRQLFTKLNVQLLPLGSFYDNPAGMTSDISLISLSSMVINVGSGTAQLIMDDYPEDTFALVSVQVSANNILNPLFSKRKILAIKEYNGLDNLDFGTEFFAEYPYFDTNYKAIVYVTAMNPYGFKSAPYFINATVL